MDFELSEELCFSEFDEMWMIEEVISNEDGEQPGPEGAEQPGQEDEEQPDPQDEEQATPEAEKQDIANDDFQVVPEEYTNEDMAVQQIETLENITPTYHACPACHKVFISAVSLDNHIDRRHQGETFRKRPKESNRNGKSSQKIVNYFVCEICSKLLRSKMTLRCHTEEHKGNYSFLCHICGKGFTNVGSFKTHLSIHTKEKRHICTLCSKEFTQKGHLTTHFKSVHIDEKPHVCHACGKKFSTKGHLSQHLKLHSSEVPRYSCESCNKAFHYPSQLKKHEKIHLDSEGKN